MADTTFVDYSATATNTPIVAAWLNDVNVTTYRAASGITGASNRTAVAKFSDFVTLKDFAAVGNGVADDRQALVKANTAAREVICTPGTYLIASSITMTVQVVMQPGASFVIPNGVTLTLNGGFQAGLYPVFTCTGTGAVVFSAGKTSDGYPEWWGAQTGGADVILPLTACYKAVRNTLLQAADYHISTTFMMDIEHKTVRGQGCQYEGAGTATRLLVTSATLDCVQMGPTAYPGSINDLYKEIKLFDVYVSRTIAPDVPSDCASVYNRYTLYSDVGNVRGAESIYAFQASGTVQMHFTNCWAFRSSAGTGGTDKFFGYFVDGSLNIGANGSNASIYIDHCNASIGGISITNCSGIYLTSPFTDCFIETPEVSACSTGITILGDASAVNQLSNTDVRITNPTIDAFPFAGIDIQDCNRHGCIEVVGGYYGAGIGATSNIYVRNSFGSVNIIGGQALCNADTSVRGVLITTGSGVTVDGMAVSEATAVAVAATDITNCDLRPIVKNHIRTCAAAVQVDGTSSRNIIAPKVFGAAGKVSLGVQLLNAGNTFTEINCSGMDSATLGASGNKLYINGVSITATGLSGNNLVSGVMA